MEYEVAEMISTMENNVHSPQSDYENLYKLSGGMPNQDKRREQLLKEQKRLRNTQTDSARGICKGDNLNIHPVNGNRRPKKKFNKPHHRIMLSEWLVDVPSDLDVSWCMKMCPAGHRCIVIADKNTTKSYSKNGHFECEFQSALPSGHEGNTSKNRVTVLDCIWCPKLQSFYVLDVMIWTDQDLTKCEAEFRFFWLTSRMNEFPELEIKSSYNDYQFYSVTHLSSDYSTVQQTLEKYPFNENNAPSIDGILFYHKEASYTAGRTPLVGWLKPFMVPEILNTPVALEYISFKPKLYTSLQNHIAYAKSKTKKQINPEMETD